MDSPSLLLFDLGGVLIENSTFESLNRLLREPMEVTALRDRWLLSSAVRRFELGAISPADFAEAFIAEWEIQLSSQAFLREFLSWPRGFYAGARETIRDLRQRYRVACLSNSNVLHWEKFGGLENDFDIALSSHQLGVIKPDDEAFLCAFRACEVDPSMVYFFDDSSANVSTARRLGVRAFQVEGIAPLIHTLYVEGLLSPI